MKLVIDIPEGFYEEVRKDPSVLAPPFLSCEKVGEIIANGTPLPKGHGRIIDESKIEVCEWVNELEEDYPKASTDAPTIIEADGGGKDEET